MRISEIWLHKDIDEAYHEIFDESVQEYNEKQTDSRRKINNYRKEIKNSKHKKEAYEVIVSVGNVSIILLTK